MKKQIQRISIHQTSKVIAMLHLLFSAIILIPAGLIVFFSTGMVEGLALLVYPLIYGIFTYILFAVYSFFYNWIASIFGGIEVSVTTVEEERKPLEE